MTAHRYVTIWCDGAVDSQTCGEFFETSYGESLSARRDARNAGWRVAMGGGRDLCPRCTSDRPVPRAKPCGEPTEFGLCNLPRRHGGTHGVSRPIEEILASTATEGER